MTRKIVVIDDAKEEFREIKRYVKKEFGDSTWNAVNSEYKAAIDYIEKNPQRGSTIQELKNLGIQNIKYKLVRQTRVVYEFNESTIYIHMFINTKRDFQKHLLKRLLNK